ncbi:AAA family ATPase [Tumebacillus avium]|uniref:AAA family ATPase n=1 Tax=Tumebacillus avium TaxID=1903704 RepID=A0A1Y0IKK4_9BACL|nr:AAA family ATPase [Tumebacillus avium]ARU59963.1 AAA family ATPase [Tumebacillus avium]
MSKYDFHLLLEPLEFEKLVCDIVQQRDGIFLKMYKEGSDMGIDGLFVDGTMKTIVQVKRYGPDFKRIFRDLEKNELPKVRKLKPDRYILGVSMEFSPAEEAKIIDLFEGYIRSEHDILNSNDINRYLELPAYKQTLLKYPKLWLPNLNIADKLFNEAANRAVFIESAEELEEAVRAAKSFVPTRIYLEALQKWSQNQVIVLSGEPGVGKTTMAYMLALSYLKQENALFAWANSIQDVYTMLDNDIHQVIILDDFWGSIFLGNQSRRNDETRLEKLIRRIINSQGKKRLILTTREYILQQGLQKHPLLRNTLEQFALVTTMEAYGDDEKASILYSHLYASSLEYDYVYYLFTQTEWIVHHENYNPRVLALFLSNTSTSDLSPEDYHEELIVYLDNPEEFWRSIFLDLSNEAQIVAMLLLISSTPMHLESMEHCYDKYVHTCNFHMTVKNLGECISELEKTMLNTVFSEDYEAILLKFSMPAVQDFLYTYLQKNCELLVPKLIECCVYYNQLQFLLEHLTKFCSRRVTDLIVQHCMVHYHNYSSSLLEYDGSWNWDVPLLDEDKGQLSRFFHLLRCYELTKHPTLYRFLEFEIDAYCTTLGIDDPETSYRDLHNFPGIIVRCIKNGMRFDSGLIEKYYTSAFSIFHYVEIQKFQNVFPEAYDLFHETYHETIKRNVKSTILAELDFLFDYDMEFEIDVLIDNIPDLLQQFELEYTEKFRLTVLEASGRNPIVIEEKDRSNMLSSDWEDHEQHSLKSIKADARDWLFGPSETYFEDDDEIAEYILESHLSSDIKKDLIKVLNNATPQHIYDWLHTMESINLLFATLDKNPSHIWQQEGGLIFSMLRHIAQDDQDIAQKLTLFCFESTHSFLYSEEPIMRLQHFMESEVYKMHLENNPRLLEVVFEHLLLRDEQWIRFIHLPLFFFCYALGICLGSEEEELETCYPEIWGANFNKLKQVIRHGSKKQINILYAESLPYYLKNYEWEGYLYRMIEEINPYHFNRYFVGPRIKSFLKKLGDGDENSKLINLLSLSKLQFAYNTSDDHFFSAEMSDAICMIEHLGIAEIWDGEFPTTILMERLLELQKEGIVHQSGDTWSLMIYKITNIRLLQELGVYDAAITFLSNVEATSSRFEDGDYSPIIRLC